MIDTKLARHVQARAHHAAVPLLRSARSFAGLRPSGCTSCSAVGSVETFRFNDFSAFYRRLRGRYDARLAEDLSGTYPDPVAHCGLCRWSERCARQFWESDDHLSLVAGLGRAQTARLAEGGITTCATVPAAAGAADRPSASVRPLRAIVAPGPPTGATSAPRGSRLRAAPAGGGPRVRATARASAGGSVLRHGGRPFYEGEGLEYLFGVTASSTARRRSALLGP